MRRRGLNFDDDDRWGFRPRLDDPLSEVRGIESILLGSKGEDAMKRDHRLKGVDG